MGCNASRTAVPPAQGKTVVRMRTDSTAAHTPTLNAGGESRRSSNSVGPLWWPSSASHATVVTRAGRSNSAGARAGSARGVSATSGSDAPCATAQTARSQGSATPRLHGVDACDVQAQIGSVHGDSPTGQTGRRTPVTPPRATSLAPAVTPPHAARRLAGFERRESAGRVWIHDTMWVTSKGDGADADTFAYSPTSAATAAASAPRAAPQPAHKRFLRTATGVLRFRSASCSAVPPARDVLRSVHKRTASSAVTPTSDAGRTSATASPTRMVEMRPRFGSDATIASLRSFVAGSLSAVRSRGRASAVSSTSAGLSVVTGRDADYAGACEGVAAAGDNGCDMAAMPTPLESVGSTGSEGSDSFFGDATASSDEELEEAAAPGAGRGVAGAAASSASEEKDSADGRAKPTVSVVHARQHRARWRRGDNAPPGSNSPVCTWEALLHDEVPQSPFGWFSAEPNHAKRRSATRPRTLSVNSHHDDDWAHPTLGHPVLPTPGKSPEGAPPPSALSPVRG